MLEFTPTKSDRLDLALFVAERSGRIAARGWLVWTVLLIGSAATAGLVAAVAVAVLANTGQLATRFPAFPIGSAAVAGALIWLTIDQLRPELRQRWARALVVRSLKRTVAGQPKGTLTRIWSDQHGLQLMASWQRRQVPWAHVREVAQSKDSIFIITDAETLLLPRRADPDQVAWLAACTTRMLTDPSQPVEAYQPVAPDEDQLITYTLTPSDLRDTQLALFAALQQRASRMMPSTLLTLVIAATVFTLAAAFIAQFRWEWALLLGVLAAIPATAYSRHTSRGRSREIAERAFEQLGLTQLASEGDWRQVRLDAAGLHYRTAAAEVAVPLPVRVVEGPRHYLLLRDKSAVPLPKRLGPDVVRFVEAVRRRGEAAAAE